MVEFLCPPAPYKAPTTLDGLLKHLGLTGSLIWDVDAGDNLSFAASSDQTLQTLPVGGSVTLVRGNDNTVDAARDAVFSGTIGHQSANEYWTSIGTTVAPITRLTAPLGTWASSAHKDNALFTFAGVFYTDAASNGAVFFSTCDGEASSVGVSMGLSTSAYSAQHLYMASLNGSGSAFAVHQETAALVGAKGQILFAAFSVDEANNTCIMALNGSSETMSCTYSSPSAAASTFPVALVTAGNNAATNTGKIFNAAWWNRALSATELLGLYTAQKVKFGI